MVWQINLWLTPLRERERERERESIHADNIERERERESIHADNMAADGIGDIATAVNSIIFWIFGPNRSCTAWIFIEIPIRLPQSLCYVT